LRASRCVLHTATAEHFGYVPLEAMAAARPVVAVNHGGPLETIRYAETGMLCAPTPAAFAAALAPLVRDARLAARLGVTAREHVGRSFSRAAFGERLEAILHTVVARTKRPCEEPR
jgi:alpha-1,3/alpha-1,6-mannosyltransferase